MSSVLDSLVESLRVPDDIDFDQYADPEDIARIRPAGDWMQEVMDEIHNPGDAAGMTLPWEKTHRDIRIRPGELTLWGGINGHGKSAILQQVIQHFAVHGETSCIASLEMPPKRTLIRSARQAITGDPPSIRYIKRYFRWLRGKMWLYDQTSTLKPRRIVGVARYCAEHLGVQHVVIDSLLKCGLAEDDYNGQKELVDALATTAKDTGVHIHLVAHVRKGDESRPPSKFDVRGAGAITDLCDNCIFVWRNKAKEEEARKPAPDPKKMDKYDALLICDKQRHAARISDKSQDEGVYGLSFNSTHQQFTERAGSRMDLLRGELDRMEDEDEDRR